jgi:flavin reductase (DIM6/NTAB) family NADH-FMN oxidoreductase RutF
MIRGQLKRFLFGGESIPQWVAIGLRPPQRLVGVFLEYRPEESVAKQAIDITNNNVIASLKPLTIAVCLKSFQHLERTFSSAQSRVIVKTQYDPRRTLGEVSLRFSRSIELPGSQSSEYRLVLFETAGSINYCLSRLGMLAYRYAESRRAQGTHNAFNLTLSPRQMRDLFVLYTCPRPVVLVSVEFGGASNLFPMDLIGQTDSGHFALALRRTSPAVDLIQRSERVALGSIPCRLKEITYELGKHHRVRQIDLERLPFQIRHSPCFGLPIPSEAISIRELQIEACYKVRSHMLFVAHTALAEEGANTDDQLFHVAGLFYRYLQLTGRVIQPA